MKAIVCTKYGPPEVLQIREVPRPVPGDNEVLIKVHSTSATLFDCWQRSCAAPPGFWWLARIANGITRPKQPILGTELSGDVEAAGKGVTGFKKGDPVFAYTGMKLGAYAEYVSLPEEAVAVKPSNMNYEQAASVLQGALTALYFLPMCQPSGEQDAETDNGYDQCGQGIDLRTDTESYAGVDHHGQGGGAGA